MIDVREYLRSFRREEAKIAMKKRQLGSLRERLTSLSVSTDKEQVSHTKNVAILSETIARIVDMEKEIGLLQDRLTASKCEAYHYFDEIPTVSVSLLMDRYFEGKTNSTICEQHFITERHLRRLMSEAINALQEIMDQAQAEHDKKMSG